MPQRKGLRRDAQEFGELDSPSGDLDGSFERLAFFHTSKESTSFNASKVNLSMKRKAQLSILSGMSIGRRIALARQRADMTQQDLADRLGVTRGAVNNWEKKDGNNNPLTARLEDIARHLRVTVDWLTSVGDDEREPAAPPETLDASLWRTLIIRTESVLQDRNVILLPEAKADCLFILYNIMIEADEPAKFDPAKYTNIIQLFVKR